MDTAITENESTAALATLPGDDVRQIMWRFADRFDLQMAVQSTRATARGTVARLVADGARMSHEWTEQKGRLLTAFDESGVTSVFMDPEDGGYIEGPKNMAMALIAFELAWVDGVQFSFADESDRIDAMLGIEYYGFDDTQIAFEVVNRHLTNYDPVVSEAPDFTEENELEMALRVNVDLLNQRLHLGGVGIVFGERAQHGATVRLEATYDLRDALAVTGGILLFMSGDRPPFDDWGDNDRLFAELKWSF